MFRLRNSTAVAEIGVADERRALGLPGALAFDRLASKTVAPPAFPRL
jgi:hypothetical protein